MILSVDQHRSHRPDDGETLSIKRQLQSRPALANTTKQLRCSNSTPTLDIKPMVWPLRERAAPRTIRYNKEVISLTTIRSKHSAPASGTATTLAQIKPRVLRVTQKYGVTNIRIFGSFARGEQRRSSDVDLLVDLPNGMTLLDLVGLKLDLEDQLGRKVDVVPARSIKPALRDSILADARPL